MEEERIIFNAVTNGCSDPDLVVRQEAYRALRDMRVDPSDSNPFSRYIIRTMGKKFFQTLLESDKEMIEEAITSNGNIFDTPVEAITGKPLDNDVLEEWANSGEYSLMLAAAYSCKGWMGAFYDSIIMKVLSNLQPLLPKTKTSNPASFMAQTAGSLCYGRKYLSDAFVSNCYGAADAALNIALLAAIVNDSTHTVDEMYAGIINDYVHEYVNGKRPFTNTQIGKALFDVLRGNAVPADLFESWVSALEKTLAEYRCTAIGDPARSTLIFRALNWQYIIRLAAKFQPMDDALAVRVVAASNEPLSTPPSVPDVDCSYLEGKVLSMDLIMSWITSRDNEYIRLPRIWSALSGRHVPDEVAKALFEDQKLMMASDAMRPAPDKNYFDEHPAPIFSKEVITSVITDTSYHPRAAFLATQAAENTMTYDDVRELIKEKNAKLRSLGVAVWDNLVLNGKEPPLDMVEEALESKYTEIAQKAQSYWDFDNVCELFLDFAYNNQGCSMLEETTSVPRIPRSAVHWGLNILGQKELSSKDVDRLAAALVASQAYKIPAEYVDTAMDSKYEKIRAAAMVACQNYNKKVAF